MIENTDKDLIPVEKVLDDMYSDKSFVSQAARDYYYLNYADDIEKSYMDHEDKQNNKIVTVFWLGYLSLIVFSFIFSMLK